MTKVAIIGAGLIGTSIGLALRGAGYDVALDDADPAHRETAVALGAGSGLQEGFQPDIVVVAVPPAAVATVIQDMNRRYITSTFTDVSSVKAQPVADVEKDHALASRFVGGHPMAGRETSGPTGARADLFVDRPWILTPGAHSEPERIDAVRALAEACGAVVTVMPASDHDRAVALTSHTPQVLASLMAGLIAKAPAADVRLSGQGLRDLTRIAGSNPELWDEILAANATEVVAVLDAFEERLASVRDALRGGRSLREMIHVGNAGLSRIPAKHGGAASAPDAVVSVSIDDRPGALARLFAAAAEAGINIDDVRIDHMLGRELAIVDLSVRQDAEEALRSALRAGGWQLRS